MRERALSPSNLHEISSRIATPRWKVRRGGRKKKRAQTHTHTLTKKKPAPRPQHPRDTTTLLHLASLPSDEPARRSRRSIFRPPFSPPLFTFTEISKITNIRRTPVVARGRKVSLRLVPLTPYFGGSSWAEEVVGEGGRKKEGKEEEEEKERGNCNRIEKRGIRQSAGKEKWLAEDRYDG